MSAQRRVALVLCVAVAQGCSAAPSAGRSPGKAPEVLAAAPQALADGGADATDQRVLAMLERVAKARGLPAQRPVRSRVLARDELLAVVRSHVEKEVPEDVIRNEGEFLVGLGLVPPSFDYVASVLDLLESQLAGFYDPDDRTMYLAADLTAAAAEATLAHELVHALQDQYYALGPRLAYRPEASDRASAVQGLAEGDATSAMMDVLLARVSRRAIDLPDELFAIDVEASVETPELRAVPRVLRASLIAPYVDGVAFVHALRRAGGWAAVDRAWRDPPQTTEQLLHVDKYEAREPAEEVGVPQAPPGAGWRPVYDDVFGEQGLRIVLEQWLSRRAAASAAEGWAGDRLALYRSGIAEGGPDAMAGSGRPQVAIAWRIRFDAGPRTDPDARAKATFRALYQYFHGGEVGRHTTVCAERRGLGALSVGRSGREVAIVAGPFEHQAENVAPRALCTQTSAWVADILSVSAR
jgi:hypothetical protein